MPLLPRRQTNQLPPQPAPESRMSRPRGYEGWEDLYREAEVEKLPWFLPRLDPDIERVLIARGISSGRVLDVGTGPGTQAMALAERGLDVVATDISETAVMRAAREAARRGIEVDFVVDDVLESRVVGPFDLILDRGCFHVLAPAARGTYVAKVRELLLPGGLLFLMVFSHLEPGDQGPYRFSPKEIESQFHPALHVASVEATIIDGQRDQPPRALFCVLERLE